jgi:hypothetical protein
MNVSFFGSDAVMLEADDRADLLKKLRHGEVISTERV